jgi:hypothetical protein
LLTPSNSIVALLFVPPMPGGTASDQAVGTRPCFAV